MSILNNLLTNEVRYLLGHNPDKYEMKSALEYLADEINMGHIKTFSEVELTLIDWRHDCTFCCANCGDHYLNEDGEYYNGVWLCSDKCYSEYIEEEETEWKNKQEKIK